MARRKESLPIEKVTLHLYEGEYDRLRQLYGTRIGAAKVVRTLVHAHILKIMADAAAKPSAQVEMDL